MMAMDEEIGEGPDSLEAPPPDPAGPAKNTGQAQATHESAEYTSAAERCNTCEHFDEAAMMCKKFNFEAEPEGHCKSWQIVGGPDEETAEGNPGEDPMDDELSEGDGLESLE